MKAEIIQVLASFVGSFGFAVLYNLRGKTCMAGISGMVSWIAYLIVWNEMPSTLWRIWQRPQLRRFMQKQWQGS